MLKRSRARHRKEDVLLVRAALDPRVTQERVMKDCVRRAVVGDTADLVLSTSPFDAMFARKLFDQSDYDAGVWFQRLFRYRASWRCRLRGMLDDGQYSSHTDSEDPRRDAEYLALVTDQRIDSGDLNLLAGIIVFHEVPRWLTAMINGYAISENDAAERRDFLRAVATLNDIWLEFAKETTETLRDRSQRQRGPIVSSSGSPTAE